MNNNLKQILQTTLNLTEAGLINLIARYPESEYDFSTLNVDADIFATAQIKLTNASKTLIDKLGVQDLVQFVTVECAE